jgi:hypothetical protein
LSDTFCESVTLKGALECPIGRTPGGRPLKGLKLNDSPNNFTNTNSICRSGMKYSSNPLESCCGSKFVSLEAMKPHMRPSVPLLATKTLFR